jgi:hypothetical protein
MCFKKKPLQYGNESNFKGGHGFIFQFHFHLIMFFEDKN